MLGISPVVGCFVGVTSGEVSGKGYFVGVVSWLSEVGGVRGGGGEDEGGGVRGGGGEDEGGGGEDTLFDLSSSFEGWG